MESNVLNTKLIFTASQGSSVKISIQGVPTASGVIVNYITNTANQPKTYGNHIYVWETTSNIVPWNKPPDGDTAVNTDSSTSTQFVDFGFEEKGYIIGYAVAPTPEAVCSTVYIPVGKQNDPKAWEYADLQISVPYQGANLVQIKYTGLTSYQPATNRNWVALWQGSQVPYAGNYMKKEDVIGDIPDGYAMIQGVKLLIGTTYSVGYFMVEPTTGRTSLAASTSFTVGQSELTAGHILSSKN